MIKLLTLLKIQYRKNKSELFVIFAFSLALFISGALIQSSFSYLDKIEKFQENIIGDKNGLYFCMVSPNEAKLQTLIDSFAATDFVESISYAEIAEEKEKGVVNAVILDEALYQAYKNNSLFPQIRVISSNPSIFELVLDKYEFPLSTKSAYKLKQGETIRALPFGLIYFDKDVREKQIEDFVDTYSDSLVFVRFEEIAENTKSTMSYAKKQTLFFPCLIFVASALFVVTAIIIYTDRTLVCNSVMRSCGASRSRTCLILMGGFGLPELGALMISAAFVIKNWLNKGTQFYWEFAHPDYQTIITLLILALVIISAFAFYCLVFVLRQETADVRKKVSKR